MHGIMLIEDEAIVVFSAHALWMLSSYFPKYTKINLSSDAGKNSTIGKFCEYLEEMALADDHKGWYYYFIDLAIFFKDDIAGLRLFTDALAEITTKELTFAESNATEALHEQLRLYLGRIKS